MTKKLESWKTPLEGEKKQEGKTGKAREKTSKELVDIPLEENIANKNQISLNFESSDSSLTVDDDWQIENFLEYFENNRNVDWFLDSKLKEIVKLEWFKNNEKAIIAICYKILGIWEIEGLELLKEIVKLEWFKNNKQAIEFSCLVILRIWEIKWLEILKEIVKLEWFKHNKKAINFSCLTILIIWDVEGLEILKEIVKLEWFKNNIQAIFNSFFAIAEIWEVEGLEILKEIVKLEWFKNNEEEMLNHFVTVVVPVHEWELENDIETSFLIEIKDGIRKFQNSDDKEIRRIGVLLLEKIW